jgi:hypothetical protein
MIDSSPSLWPTFQQLANDYPDCNAVKLTVELQRWFIKVHEQHFLDRVLATLEPAESQPV